MRKFNLSSSKIQGFLFLAVILTVVVFSYYPTLKNDFVFWDDDVHLYENISVRTLDLEHISDIFKSTVNKIYIPLTTLSFAVEHRFFEYDPFIYHLDNLLLHLGVVALTFWLGLRLGLSVAGSGVAALLFGIHPMHVESVAWVMERKDVLYSFFYMASLLSYSRYLGFTKSTKSFQIKKSYRFLVLTVIFGILSMLAKPMALSLPLILLLLDWFHGRKIGREAVLEKVPLGIIIAGITWVSYVGHARIPGKGIAEGVLIWAWTFVFYLRQFAFPAFSVPVYQIPKPIMIANPEYLLPVLTIGFLLIAIIRFRKRRWFIFSVAFYLFSIFFLLRYDYAKDATIVADRFMYLPSLGFCFLAGLGGKLLLEKKGWRWAGVAVIILLTVGFSAKTYKQCRVWRDSISLWRHQLSIFPDEPIALNNLAVALQKEEKYRIAIEEFRKITMIKAKGLEVDLSDWAHEVIDDVERLAGLYKHAIASDPDFADAQYNLGKLYADAGRIPEAVTHYKEALKIDYNYKDAHFNLGDLYRKAGDVDQAIFAYGQALKLHPESEDVYIHAITAYTEALEGAPGNAVYLAARQKVLDDLTHLISSGPAKVVSFFNLGYLYSEMGDLVRAISAYQMALDINPNHSNTLYNLGNVYRDQGRLGEALEVYQKVVRLNPRKSDAFINMGAIYKRRGDLKEAKKNFQKAIKADSHNATAYFNLGYLEEKAGNLRESIDLYLKSIEFDPKGKETYYNLGNTYARLGKNSEAISSYLKAVDVDPDYMDAWVNLSILSFKAGDFSDAVKYYDKAFLQGYAAPQGYLNALEPYRKK